MTRKEYVKFCQSKKTDKAKQRCMTMPSVTDPTFAQTGRQMLTNPLPINYRVRYSEGAPLNPDDPHKFNEFDKMYPDKFKAMVEAKEQVNTTKKNLKKASSDYEEKQKETKQPETKTPEN